MGILNEFMATAIHLEGLKLQQYAMWLSMPAQDYLSPAVSVVVQLKRSYSFGLM